MGERRRPTRGVPTHQRSIKWGPLRYDVDPDADEKPFVKSPGQIAFEARREQHKLIASQALPGLWEGTLPDGPIDEPCPHCGTHRTQRGPVLVLEQSGARCRACHKTWGRKCLPLLAEAIVRYKSGA